MLSELGTTLRSRRKTLRDGLPTVSSGVLDFEEHALDAEEQVLGFSLLEITTRTVHGIEAALLRLEAGEFGRCSDCRSRISVARLRAVPFAGWCLACQAKRDVAAVAATRSGSTGH